MAAGSSKGASNPPYRLEVQDITPVSVSLLWSLRPPPLSAIPRGLVQQQRQLADDRIVHSSGSNSPTAGAPPSSRHTTTTQTAASTSVLRDRLKKTTVTQRNISPAKRGRIASKASPSAHIHAAESEDWPSDEGTTAVDDDEVREADDDLERTLDEASKRFGNDTASESSEEGDDAEADASTKPSSKLLDTNVSISVNAVPWGHVVMSDRGSDEAILVIYGLMPSRDYEIDIQVHNRFKSKLSLTTAKKRSRPTEEAKHISEQTISQPIVPAPASSTVIPTRSQTPPMQDTDTRALDAGMDSVSSNTSLNASLPVVGSGTASSSTLQAAVRKARKEASRAESALRNEIEAIKRGLDRMSDVDHRSKQKVLALQESIRQATLHAKDIDEETLLVEGEQPSWEAEEAETEESLTKVREAAQQQLKAGQEQLKEDESELEAVEKELRDVTKTLEDKWLRKETLEKERIFAIEEELKQIQAEIERLLQPSTQPYSQPALQSYSRDVSGMPTHMGHSPGQPSFSPSQTNQSLRGGRTGGRGSSRFAFQPLASTNSTRRNQYRPKGNGFHTYSNASEEALYNEGHVGPIHSAHGSTLNPHNPEFVPANASPMMNKSAIGDYSPIQTSRFPFAAAGPSVPLDQSAARHNIYGPVGISPQPNYAPSSSSMTPWSMASAPSGSPWPPTQITSSPTLGHDIWAAPLPSTTGKTFPSASSQHSPNLALQGKYNSASLRAGTIPAIGTQPRMQGGYQLDKRGSDSAPVSPRGD